MSFWGNLYQSRIIKYLPGYFRKKLKKHFNYYFVDTSLSKLPENNYPFITTLEKQENLMHRFNSENYIPWTTCPYLVQILKTIFHNQSHDFNFLDFGGENIDYFLYLKKNLKNLNYYYFNQKKNNEVLKVLKKKYSIEDLNIINDLDDIKKNKYQFINLGSVIQYVENYKSALNMFMDLNPEYIFLTGIHFFKGIYRDKSNQRENTIVKQLNVFPQINFLYFFEYETFINMFKSKKFELIFKTSNYTDKINYNNLVNKYDKVEYADIMMKNMNN